MKNDHAFDVHKLLEDLHALLLRQGERNWIRGVEAALAEISQEDGFDRAKSIYKSMSQGNGSFSDYYVWVEDFDQRQAENRKLGEIREKIWHAFDL